MRRIVLLAAATLIAAALAAPARAQVTEGPSDCSAKYFNSGCSAVSTAGKNAEDKVKT